MTFSWSAPINSQRDATVVIREALLPMLLCLSVPVVREVEQKLTVIDRFVLEAALLMTPVTAADVAEVTGVPQDVVSRIAGRLVRLRLLVPEEIGYAPAESTAEALNRASVLVRQIVRLTFLYLPQGDDLIAYEDGSRRVDPPQLHRAVPHTTASLPPDVAERSLAAFLRERIAAGRVTGLPAGVVDVAETQLDENHRLPLGCPAFRCSGNVVATDTDVELRLRTAGPQRKQINYNITGATGQAAYWSSRAEWTGAAVEAWTATGGTVESVRTGPTQWSLTLDGPAAEAAPDGIDLSNPGGLSTRTDDCVTYVDVSFVPADNAARRVFAMQDALLRITSKVPDELEDDVVAEAAASARARYGLTAADLDDAAVHDQLWIKKHYHHVYALRKDFVHHG